MGLKKFGKALGKAAAIGSGVAAGAALGGFIKKATTPAVKPPRPAMTPKPRLRRSGPAKGRPSEGGTYRGK